jgi:hypothetical protein
MRINSFALSLGCALRFYLKSFSFLLLLLAGSLSPLCGQEKAFPENWEGAWSGTLEIFHQNRLRQTVPMELSIRPVDSTRWEYLTVYNPSGKGVVKAYELISLDPTKGKYAIDERNGIVLDAQYQNGCLYSSFTVMGSYLQSRTCLLDSALHYEIISGPEKASHTVGDTIIDTDTIPPVQVFARPSVQRAILSKRRSEN